MDFGGIHVSNQFSTLPKALGHRTRPPAIIACTDDPRQGEADTRNGHEHHADLFRKVFGPPELGLFLAGQYRMGFRRRVGNVHWLFGHDFGRCNGIAILELQAGPDSTLVCGDPRAVSKCSP